MAAATTAATTTPAVTTLTPPHSSHGNGNAYAWDVPSHHHDDPSFNRGPLVDDFEDVFLKPKASQDEGVSMSRAMNSSSTHNPHVESNMAGMHWPPSSKGLDPESSQCEVESTNMTVSGGTETGLTENTTNLNGVVRDGASGDFNKRAAATELYGSDPDDVSSKWIHRDKLARIESEELQAAGIILPKARARSKPRRDTTADKVGSHRKGGLDGDIVLESRSRKSSSGVSDRVVPGNSVHDWDLRLPEEIAAEAYFVSSGGARGLSRIPVAKLSPAPIPLEHMERDTPITRTHGDSFSAEESITYPKLRSRSSSVRVGDGSVMPIPTSSSRNPTRSTSDISPKKTAGAALAPSTIAPRKTSSPPKTNPTTGRPKTRNGASKDLSSNGTGSTRRPSTRSPEREWSRELSPGASSKQPEGEPPWMISAYRPDPRLPPDQQLLPTVAKRLQQEKWEREGKFGNVYDKEFRPLTDEGFLTPPEMAEGPSTTAPMTTATTSASSPTMTIHDSEHRNEWPLKPDGRSPTSQPGRTGSYSTIPRIQDKPNGSSIPSPRDVSQIPNSAVVRTPAVQDEEESSKNSCGCCTIM